MVNTSGGHHTATGRTPLAPEGSETNPFGLGDPNDRFLRRVEREILVPKKMRDKAKVEKCQDEVAAFTECCKNSSIAMVLTCRRQNTKLKDCLGYWYNDTVFKKTCEEEYLNERSEYRRTGIKQKFWTKDDDSQIDK